MPWTFWTKAPSIQVPLAQHVSNSAGSKATAGILWFRQCISSVKGSRGEEICRGLSGFLFHSGQKVTIFKFHVLIFKPSFHSSRIILWEEFISNQLYWQKMETRTIYDRPQCEVMELEEQSVLCSSATEVDSTISNPWGDLTEEEW